MNITTNIQPKNILVVGDIMLDTYFYGAVERISPEAPVPVFKKTKERSVLGGAGNVAANLSAAKQNVSVLSLVGNDETGEKLLSIFKENGINTDLLFRFEGRPTTEKIRFLATTNNQQVLRLDIEETSILDQYYSLLEAYKGKLSSFDLILISDYLKGLLSETFTQNVIIEARKHNIPVVVDVKGHNADKYKHATLIKPNQRELSELTNLPMSTDEELVRASKKLQDKCCCKYVLTTCGSKGMLLVGGDDEPYFVKSVGKEVFDVTGAGDTVIAYLATGMANGLSIIEAVDLANIAAGIQVSKVGTSAVYWNEIQKVIDNVEKDKSNIEKNGE